MWYLFYDVGGIGEAVAAALVNLPETTLHKLAVKEIPRSGRGDELLEKYEIDAGAIIKAVEALLKKSWNKMTKLDLIIFILCLSVMFIWLERNLFSGHKGMLWKEQWVGHRNCFYCSEGLWGSYISLYFELVPEQL